MNFFKEKLNIVLRFRVVNIMLLVLLLMLIFFTPNAGAYVDTNVLPGTLKNIDANGYNWSFENGKYKHTDTTAGGFGGASASSYTYYNADGTKGNSGQIVNGQDTNSSNNPNDLMIWVTTAVGWLLAGASMFLGYVLTVILTVLINVASFNKIIDVPVVVTGWVVIRDICNMFFVLILLVIAFATILRMENYSLKKSLPKLIIAAVLINFSRTIFGLIIDFSQVIMLTFVNAFASTGGGNFVSLFQLDKYLSMSKVSEEAFKNNSALAVLAGMIGAFIALLITTVVIVVLLAVLLMRVIMLWVYTILSPFVFLGHAFSGAQKYTSQIWGDFTKQIIVGPLLAFFIWLALVTAQSSSDAISKNTNLGIEAATKSQQFISNTTNNTVVQAFSDIYSSNNFQKYIITIALLIGGLMVTQQIGGFAGQMAGKGMGWIQSGKKLAWNGINKGADWINRKQAKRTGVDLNVWRQADRIQRALGRGKERELKAIATKSTENLQKGGIRGYAGGFTAEGWADQYLGVKGLWKAGKGSLMGMYTSKNKGILPAAKALLGMGAGSEPYAESLVAKANLNDIKEKGATVSVVDYNKTLNQMEKEQQKAKFDKDETKYNEATEKIKALNEGWNNNLKHPLKKKTRDRIELIDAENVRLEAVKKGALEHNDQDTYNKATEQLIKNSKEKSDLTKPFDDYLVSVRGKVGTMEKKMSFFSVKDLEGQAKIRASISEAGKNVNSENEDELVADFQGALAENNMALAAAISKQIFKVGGGNALLGKFGYNVRGGLTEEEEKKLKVEGRGDEIKKSRGLNDFMRDIFRDKLKMSEPTMLALQSDIAEMAKGINHDYAAATISVNRQGRLHQVTESEQAANLDNETSKGDVETLIRRGNRLKYGAEDAMTKEFKWSESGLMFFAQNVSSILKEISGKRFNRSAAKKVSETGAIKVLEEYLTDLQRNGIQFNDTSGNIIADIKTEFIDKLKSYASSSSKENIEKIKEAAEKFKKA